MNEILTYPVLKGNDYEFEYFGARVYTIHCYTFECCDGMEQNGSSKFYMSLKRL